MLKTKQAMDRRKTDTPVPAPTSASQENMGQMVPWLSEIKLQDSSY
jgi:hypothetical protein